MAKLALTAALAVALVCSSAFAAAPDDNWPPRNRGLSAIQKQVEAGNYWAVLDRLQTYVDRQPRDADGWNLLGYVRRKTGDYEDSLEAYQQALAIDDGHLDANAYLGELYVQTGRMADAEAQLEKLERLCGRCEEYEELAAAIANSN